jgi:hypothetical protein
VSLLVLVVAVPGGALGGVSREAADAARTEAQQLQGAILAALLMFWGIAYVVGRLRVPGKELRILRWIATPPPRTVVRDVTLFAQARLTRAQLELATRLVGVFFAAASLQYLASGNVATLLFIPFGAVLVWVGPHVVRWVSHAELGPAPERERNWVREGRDPLLTTMVLGIATAAVLVGLVGVAFSVGATMDAADVDGGLSDDERSQVGIVLMLVGFGSGVLLHRVGRRMANRHAAEVLAQDRRPPVLLLRSFSDDRLLMRVMPADRHSFLGRIGLQRVERFEEVLAWSLAPYGPVTAIAEPGHRARPLGAAREQLQTQDWLAVVTQRIVTARVIVLVVGTSPGLAAEVDTLRRVGALDRTLFVIPPVPWDQARWRWAAVAATLGGAVVPSPHPYQPEPLGAVVTARQGWVVHYTGVDRRDVTYEAAVDLAMADLAIGDRGASDPRAGYQSWSQ